MLDEDFIQIFEGMKKNGKGPFYGVKYLREGGWSLGAAKQFIHTCGVWDMTNTNKLHDALEKIIDDDSKQK